MFAVIVEFQFRTVLTYLKWICGSDPGHHFPIVDLAFVHTTLKYFAFRRPVALGIPSIQAPARRHRFPKVFCSISILSPTLP